jgi:hypothetical protein
MNAFVGHEMLVLEIVIGFVITQVLLIAAVLVAVEWSLSRRFKAHEQVELTFYKSERETVTQAMTNNMLIATDLTKKFTDTTATFNAAAENIERTGRENQRSLADVLARLARAENDLKALKEDVQPLITAQRVRAGLPKKEL